MPLAITLYSALTHLGGAYDATVFVIGSGISDANERRLRRVVRQSSCRVDLELIRVDPGEYAHLKSSGHLSMAAFFRLMLPSLIPARFGKVIYLDSDLLVRADLSQIWRADMLGMPLLAVRDYSAPVVSSKAAGLPYQSLGIDPSAPYLNSGVLVMDLARWRADNYAEEVFRHTVKYEDEVRYGDQDGINAVMAGRWGELDPLWNVQLYISVDRLFRHIEDSPHKQQLHRDRWRLVRDAHIWHYIGSRKPWAKGCALPGQLEWLKLLRRSGWFEPGEIELNRMLWQLHFDWLLRKTYRKMVDGLDRLGSSRGAGRLHQ